MEENSMLLNINLGESSSVVRKKGMGNDKKHRIRIRKKIKFDNLVRNNLTTRKKLGTYEPKLEKAGKRQKTTVSPTSEENMEKQAVAKVKVNSITTNPVVSKKPKQDVISSLFNKNPEIPRIPEVEVSQIEEQVFSKKKFSQLPLHPHLVSCLDRMCATEMTEVQQRAIPQLLESRDALLKSQTGSGKTLSYAVPLIQILRSKQERIKRSDGVVAVILVPTRELALQSLAVIKKLLQSCIWIVPGLVIGGESRKSEKARLRKGVNILVATPGRLVDHCNSTHSLSFSKLEHLIIDEADRLLDMGFEKDIAEIMRCIKREERRRYQTVLLSATLSTDVKNLASVALTDPITVDVSAASDISQQSAGGDDSTFALPSSLKQYFIVAPCKLRLVTLAAFMLQKCKHSKTTHKLIIFLPSQELVQFYYQLFQGTINSASPADSSSELSDDEQNSEFFDLFALHGDMDQKYRSEVYTRFAQAQTGILLCTDVAARGLDIEKVDWIIQLSPPATTELYVHRVGRTARIGGAGSSLLFLLPSEIKYLDILSASRISLKPLELDSILKACKQESSLLPAKRGSGQTPRNIQESATALQQSLEEWTYNASDRLAQAKSAYQSFVRAYATYPTKVKDIFHVKNLHLGHLAKSFCLREAPAGMTGTSNSRKLDRTSKARKKAETTKSNRKRTFDRISEFSSG
ncbi:ATP-dependent DNA helicase DDX31-like [Watersipora subatra]|uniref:ATP-dependent DNA helicase DDX31-like n=1 Tax=Watersipora subatra TaxID=2589382 RepID=UPI00355ADC4F